MSIKNQDELFVRLLSAVKFGSERTTKIFQQLAQAVDDPDIKEAFESRVFISDQIGAKLDRCFKLIGAQPVQPSDRLYDMFAEDFRKELAEIETPGMKKLFVLATATTLIHLRVAAYTALITMADATGHIGVGVLLESCLADKQALLERTKRLARSIVEVKVLERMAR